MEINKAISNQNVIITLKGRLDTMTAPQLDDEAKSIDFDEVETVTLNLKDLEYISSSGLRVILALYKNLKSKGGNLKIVNVSNTCIDYFRQVMSRHIRSHTNGDTRSTIYK